MPHAGQAVTIITAGLTIRFARWIVAAFVPHLVDVKQTIVTAGPTRASSAQIFSRLWAGTSVTALIQSSADFL
jgi:hypothetical protein